MHVAEKAGIVTEKADIVMIIPPTTDEPTPICWMNRVTVDGCMHSVNI